MIQAASQARSVTGELSAYIAGALERPLPTDVAEKAKHHILDTIAAMVSGSRLKPGRLAIVYIRRQGGAREALVVGSRVVTTAVNAALANGMLAHADETDDSHAPSFTHPGCAIVPAALAMAERHRCDGHGLLRAVVLGYDIGCRTTRALGPDHLTRAFRSSHSLGGLFGAAVAAGALASLDAAQVGYLLSYTVQQASGVTSWVRDQEHIEKAFDFGGMPARNGVTAATMVAAGFTGVEDALSGEQNFFDAFSSDPRPQELVRDLGSHYEVMLTNLKKWPVGSPIQAALDALLELMRQHSLRAEGVERLVARLPEDMASIVDNRHMPDINLQHMLAVTLLDGRLTFVAAHDYERMRDPAVLALRQRIELVGDPELTHARPPRQAIVEIVTRNGQRFSQRTYAVRGTADNPMDSQEVEEKALDLMAPVLGAPRARSLVQQVCMLERVGDVRALRPLLQGNTTHS